MGVQHKIVSVLSTYDDLIENNTRRIEILEEMARRLYEEWFVHFRFPGHEEVSFKESELGGIPEYWEVGTLQDVIVLQRGFDLPVKKRTPGDFPIVSATGVSGTHVEAKIDGPGVVTGRSGSIGKVMYVHGSYWPLNTTLWGKAFPLGSSLFAFYTLSAIDLKGFNVGAAVPTLNRNDIHGLPVILPAKEVVQLFDQVAGPIHELVVTLEKKNANLRTQRDLLLPKLVSGEIDVSDIPMPDDKEVEAA
jgi:type I restriction enzyme S subunit